MPSLREELAGGREGRCKVCTFLNTLPQTTADEWRSELALPHEVNSHAAFVLALRRRGVSIEEASVRRHRKNHV